MLQGLNDINIGNWKNDPNVSVKIGQQIEADELEKIAL